MASEITAQDIGKRLYTRSGQAVELLDITIGGGLVVYDLVEVINGDDQFETYGPQRIETELFRRAPREVRDQELVEIEAMIAEAKNALTKSREEAATAESDRKALLLRLKKHDALKHIDRFLNEPPTHAVVAINSPYSIHLCEADKAFVSVNEDRDSWTKVKPWKLISLFGDTKGNLTWQVADWSDGSGRWQPCQMFWSYEEARQFLVDVVTAEIARHLAAPQHHGLWNWTDVAEKNSIPMSPEAIAWLTAYRKDIADRELAKAEEALRAAREKHAAA